MLRRRRLVQSMVSATNELAITLASDFFFGTNQKACRHVKHLPHSEYITTGTSFIIIDFDPATVCGFIKDYYLPLSWTPSPHLPGTLLFDAQQQNFPFLLDFEQYFTTTMQYIIFMINEIT